MDNGSIRPTGQQVAIALALFALTAIGWVLAHGLLYSFAEAHLWTR